MIITVTLNPAMDKTVTVENLTVGAVNRVTTERYDIGGKGINVSKVLKKFDLTSTGMGFLGGLWEPRFEQEFITMGVIDEFIRIKGDTRTNTKIVDPIHKFFTDINAPGPIIETSEVEQLIQRYSSLCKAGDIVVLSGGVAPGIPVNIYNTLTVIAKQNGAKVILDAEGELLREGLKALPHVIKPNAAELSTLMGVDGNNLGQLIGAALQLKERGIEQILVSLGDKGSFYVSEEDVIICEGEKVEVKSTVGAGDSMVAALVYSMTEQFGKEETLAFANACGAVTVALEGTMACSLTEVKEMLPRMKCYKWSK